MTGASRGIGRAIAVGLAEQGYDILAVARSVVDLEDSGKAVRGFGRDFRPIAVDLAELDGTRRVIDAASSWRDGVDVLVNAAGMIIRTDPPDVEPEQVDATFALNVRAPLLLCQGLQPALAARSGSIINVTSLAAEVVTRASVTYQASKAALLQLSRALAHRFGPDVRVNAVGPGYIETDLNRDWLADPTNRRYVEQHTSLRRVGEPADVVGLVVFLASPAAAYVTGQHYIVDGGWRVD